MTTTKQHNAQVRAEKALQEGSKLTQKDQETLEEMPQAWEILDNLEEQHQLAEPPKSPQAQKQKPTEEPQNLPPIIQEWEIKEAKSAVSEVRDLSGAGAKETPVKKRVPGPRERDYLQFFEHRFGPLIVLLLYISMADLEKATFYAPSPSECHDMAPHLARLGPRVEDLLHFPKWVHDVVVTSDDTFTVGMVLVGYLDRIGVLEQLLPWFTGAAAKVRRVNNEQASGGPSPIPFSGPRADPATNGNGGPPPDLSNVTGLGEQWRPV